MAEYIEKEDLDHAFFLLGYDESDLPRRMLGRMAAADVVPVVRCKDCRYMKELCGARYCEVWKLCNGGGDDGFCNYGEKEDQK